MAFSPLHSITLCERIYNSDFHDGDRIAGAIVEKAWRNDDHGHDFALCSTDDDIIICVRGTNFDEMSDIITNIKLAKERVTLHDGRSMRVHTGYHQAAKKIISLLKNKLDMLILSNMRPILVTGHSLGGAVASLIALYLQDIGYDVVSCRTFAAPAVGDSRFAAIMKQEFPTFERYVYELDFVPFLLFFYHHPAPAIVLYKDGTSIVHEINVWLTILRIMVMVFASKEKRVEALYSHYPFTYVDVINLMKKG
jgi:hypothetical protein